MWVFLVQNVIHSSNVKKEVSQGVDVIESQIATLFIANSLENHFYFFYLKDTFLPYVFKKLLDF